MYKTEKTEKIDKFLEDKKAQEYLVNHWHEAKEIVARLQSEKEESEKMWKKVIRK